MRFIGTPFMTMKQFVGFIFFSFFFKMGRQSAGDGSNIFLNFFRLGSLLSLLYHNVSMQEVVILQGNLTLHFFIYVI